jgi:phospholipid transport system substrate-binding protein
MAEIPSHCRELVETDKTEIEVHLLKTLSAAGLAILLLMPAVSSAAETAGQQLRQTVDKLLRILNDPQVKGDGTKSERRRKLRAVIGERFDFAEMARRSLGPHWRRVSPQQQKEFVKAFTGLLEDAYLDKIESYEGQKVQFINERQDNNAAQVDTKIIDHRGQEFSVDYRLHNVNGSWKVYDVIIEEVSLINNYRSQFNRVLAKSSFDELLQRMKEKKVNPPPASPSSVSRG